MNRPSILATERLVLRPFGLDDAAEVRRLAGDRAIADTTINIPHPYQSGMAEEWISGHEESFVKGKEIHFAITCKPDNILVGAIGLMGIIKSHQAELGYWIGMPYWNQGFCSEAGKAVLQYAFLELALNRVHARHFTRNPSSGRVMQKLGMSPEGTLRQHVIKWGNDEDMRMYGILKEEWEQVM